MIFAMEEINNSPTILPNISLGYHILNSCASPTNTLRAALTLVSRTEENESTSACRPPVTALIAESGSSQSIILAGTFGPFQVPIVRPCYELLESFVIKCCMLLVQVHTKHFLSDDGGMVNVNPLIISPL